MCGRAYSTFTDEELALRYENKKPIKVPALKPNYNMSPTHEAPIVHSEEGERQIELFRWGLVPFWAKDIKIGYKMINARAETITEKPSFRKAFETRRCIVPLSGFFEWKREGESKRPFCIHLKNEPIMSVAGIWERCTGVGPKELFSFAIITTKANSLMEKIHDRMPVILRREDEQAWLEESDQKAVEKLLKPCPATWLAAHEISTMVNSPRNNRPEVLEPLAE